MLFMVHSGLSNVVSFAHLANCFENERPFYVLWARGFRPGQPSFSTVDEMVSCYAAAVKRTQPQEPYVTAGYPPGRLVPFEVAKRLEGMGDQVKFASAIDIPPHVSDNTQEMGWTDGLLKVSYSLGLVSKQGTTDLVPSALSYAQ